MPARRVAERRRTGRARSFLHRLRTITISNGNEFGSDEKENEHDELSDSDYGVAAAAAVAGAGIASKRVPRCKEQDSPSSRAPLSAKTISLLKQVAPCNAIPSTCVLNAVLCSARAAANGAARRGVTSSNDRFARARASGDAARRLDLAV